MVLPFALEVGTVYSRSVKSMSSWWIDADDRSGHRPHDAHCSEPFSARASTRALFDISIQCISRSSFHGLPFVSFHAFYLNPLA
jgi:hypothetical protein